MEVPAIGDRIVRLSRCTSTNDEAARLAAEGAEHGTVVVADEQTAGRGREGRRWYSPPGENLYLSCILRPELDAASVPPITLAAGIAVCEAVNSFGARASLKWPNDVLAGGRKLAGVLTEMQSRGTEIDHVLLGIGVNVDARPESFPPELASAVTSLSAERGGEPVRREELLEALLAGLDRWLGRFFAGGVAAIADEWIRRMAPEAARVRARAGGRTVEGRPIGIGGRGELLVEEDGGLRHRVVAGDVEMLR